MKKALLVTAIIFISFNIYGQAPAKKDSIPPAAQAVQNEPADSLKIISRNDLEEFVKYTRENISVSNYEKMNPVETIRFLYLWILQKNGQTKPGKK